MAVLAMIGTLREVRCPSQTHPAAYAKMHENTTNHQLFQNNAGVRKRLDLKTILQS
jgi:hypothetical protein